MQTNEELFTAYRLGQKQVRRRARVQGGRAVSRHEHAAGPRLTLADAIEQAHAVHLGAEVELADDDIERMHIDDGHRRQVIRHGENLMIIREPTSKRTHHQRVVVDDEDVQTLQLRCQRASQ